MQSIGCFQEGEQSNIYKIASRRVKLVGKQPQTKNVQNSAFTVNTVQGIQQYVSFCVMLMCLIKRKKYSVQPPGQEGFILLPYFMKLTLYIN